MVRWRILLPIVVLPGTVTVLVPFVLLQGHFLDNIGWGLAPPLRAAPILVGGAVVLCGLTLMALTIRLFTNVGAGSLAPWDPPRRLVVRGIYRHVRNPMISGVFLVLVGESVLFGSRPVFEWAVLFWIINAVYIPLLEEPGLARRFGDSYLEYKANVPRWIPRITTWVPAPGREQERR